MVAIRRSRDKWWAYAIGAGVALSPIHNQWLTEAVKNGKGEVMFFLPAFGYLLLIMAAGLFLLNNWHRVQAIGWGDRRIVGCLLLIVVAISLSGFTYSGFQGKLAPMGMGLVLFALYLCGRVLGKSIFLPLAVGAAVASLGVIIHQIVYPGAITGGFVFEDNYDIVVGYVLLGAALWIHKRQWILAGLALVAILLTGSPEGTFALSVVGIAILRRRDWSRRLVIVLAPVVVIVVIGLVSGYGLTLYGYAGKIVAGETASPYENRIPLSDIGEPRDAIGYRLEVIKDALSNIKPLGEGYNLTDFSRSRNVHNVPLVLVQQLGYPGILAALAWLFVSIWCLVRTKWRYLFILILSLSAFDHYVWTQLAPVWPAIVGASTTSRIGSDLIFRKDKGVVCDAKDS